MATLVDPSADYIWGAVVTTVDASGQHDKQPSNDAEWHELRQRAVVLAEAANLASVPGRRVAHGDKTIEDEQPLDVEQIQGRLDSRNDHRGG